MFSLGLKRLKSLDTAGDGVLFTILPLVCAGSLVPGVGVCFSNFLEAFWGVGWGGRLENDPGFVPNIVEGDCRRAGVLCLDTGVRG